MVKSRPDISFPVYKDNMSENELNEWKQQWNTIINEYENVLRKYILQDFNISEN
jgi:aminoglycoside/choline kinase family phosphotransferase